MILLKLTTTTAQNLDELIIYYRNNKPISKPLLSIKSMISFGSLLRSVSAYDIADNHCTLFT